MSARLRQRVGRRPGSGKMGAMRAFVVLSLSLLGCSEVVPTPGPASPDDAQWRSALYPTHWTPEFTDEDGRFLHDFSYSGYKNGEVPLPDEVPGDFHRVVLTSDGSTDVTALLQTAIDEVGARGGGTVFLPEGLYRVDGLLTVEHSGVVLRGEGPERSRLWFTRATQMTDKASLTFKGSVEAGELVPLAEDAPNRSNVLLVTDASGLAPGDSIGVGWKITDEFIERHGMTGVWKSFNGKWRTFFRREVVAIDRSASPHRVTLDVPMRYPAFVSDDAGIRIERGYVTNCGLASLGISNAVDEDAAWEALRAHAVDFIGTADCFVENVESFPPPTEPPDGFHLQSGGVRVLDSKRVTLERVSMARAQNRGEGGCGYLFEVSRSSEVLIRDSVGREGRHNFIQNWDFGTSGLVLLRVESTGGVSMSKKTGGMSSLGASEFHHSLAMANLIDSATVNDGFQALNRKHWSSGAGHSATQSVFWNIDGRGFIESHQYGDGYVIGTSGVSVNDSLLSSFYAEGAEPDDHLEGVGEGRTLFPRSLYEDQLARRLAR